MKVFLKIVENYNLAACSKEQANQETKSTKGTNESLEESFFIVKNYLRNSSKQKAKERSSSKEEHKVNALASGADEGRDKLR